MVRRFQPFMDLTMTIAEASKNNGIEKIHPIKGMKPKTHAKK